MIKYLIKIDVQRHSRDSVNFQPHTKQQEVIGDRTSETH